MIKEVLWFGGKFFSSPIWVHGIFNECKTVFREITVNREIYNLMYLKLKQHPFFSPLLGDFQKCFKSLKEHH